MKIIFIGVGEAFDVNHSNTSIVVQCPLGKKTSGNNGNETVILLDCGFTAAHALWKFNSNPDWIDILYISHFHADHTFGIPALMLKMSESKREKKLKIIGQPGTEDFFYRLMEIGYPGFVSKLKFGLEFLCHETNIETDELIFRFAPTEHSISNYAVSIDDLNKRLVYSGDGKPSKESLNLYKGCDLLIHEAYALEENIPGHGSIQNIQNISKEFEIKTTALIHLSSSIRDVKGYEIRNRIKKHNDENPNCRIMLPESGDQLFL